MLTVLTIDQYLSDFTGIPLIDVRTPAEFMQGHIPGAINIPLFSNEERAVIGTVYKQKSREEAVALGFEFVTPKREHLLNQCKSLISKEGLVIHCWRGGMRSRFFAEQLVRQGVSPVYVIERGYKAFRRKVISTFEQEYTLHTIGGYTGSAKTEMLGCIRRKGYQVIDLEALACHKGSAFGNPGNRKQPSSEQFENDLFMAWRHFDPAQPIWIEDESRNIGSVFLPSALYAHIRNQPVFFVDIPRKHRANYLKETYGHTPKEEIAAAIHKITRKLGGQHARRALGLLEQDNLEEGVHIVLAYYDKLYEKGVHKRDPSLVIRVPLQEVNPEFNAAQIIHIVENKTYLNTVNTI